MKKEIEELKRKLADAEKRIAALEGRENRIEYHFHSYPPVFMPQIPAPTISPNPWPPTWPVITCGAGNLNGEGTSVRFVA